MKPLTQAQQELYDWLVEYIQTTQHAPSIRQMMRAMNLRSPAPIQSRLERLRNKGYLEWTKGKARTIRILYHKPKGISILGEIRAGGIIETFTDVKEKLDLSNWFKQANCYVLRVVGDSLIEDLIAEGDLAIMRTISPDDGVKNGEIVVARVEGYGTTLKRFYQENGRVLLKSANSNYQPMEMLTHQVEIQGVLVGIWRDCTKN